MVSFKATGPIHSISPVIEIPSKTGGNSFLKREVVIDDSWVDRDTNPHTNYVLIEFSGDQLMQQLDYFRPGQRVVIDVCVNGREYNGRIFISLKGRGISEYQPQQQPQAQQPQSAPTYPQQGYAPAPAPMPGYPQQGAPAYPQAPGYPQPTAPAYPQQQQYAPAPAAPMPGQHNGDLGPDGLPFR